MVEPWAHKKFPDFENCPKRCLKSFNPAQRLDFIDRRTFSATSYNMGFTVL